VAAAVVHRNGNGPLCILDLALPSDVDPKVAELETVSLLGLADVQDRLKQNVALRMQQVGPAEALVEEVVQGYTGPLC
jgi:glutamyl-tRNA reductase